MKKSTSILFLIILSIGMMNMPSAQEPGNTVAEPSAISVKQADFQNMRARLKAMTSEERQRFVENMKNLSPQQKRDVEQRVREIVESE